MTSGRRHRHLHYLVILIALVALFLPGSGLAGDGVEKNPVKAREWFLRSANQGEGVPKDQVQAFMWLTLSDHFGYDRASQGLEHLDKLLTPAQKKKAREMSRSWLNKHGS